MTTKLHMATDEEGRIIRMVFTGGNKADISSALDLIQGLKPAKLLADKGYDADWLMHYLDSEDIEAVIPPKSNRTEQREYDRQTYRKRNVIERVFARLKEYKKIATRYEKTTASFASLCFMAATFLNLNVNTA